MNLILIVADTFRFDNLFQRAHMPVHTPNLDAFAGRAVSAAKMYAAGFPTVSHRRNLISGRYWPWPPWGDHDAGPQNILPRLLKQAGGHVTQFLGDCPHLFGAGFKAYFDAAHVLRGQEGDVYFLRMNRPIGEAMPPGKTRTTKHFQNRRLVDLHRWTNYTWRGEQDRFAVRLADLAIEWLEENCHHHPFFLWLDFFDPHEPWDPPEYMVRAYDPQYLGCPMLHPNYGKASDLSAPELHNLRAHYCAEVELVDRQIGRFVQRLDDLKLWSSTAVVFTTDHGTSLGEHNRTGKGNRNVNDDRYWPPYPEVAHLPFMISAPGLAEGTEIDTLLEPTDILPTLLDLLDLEGRAPEAMHGQSFLPNLQGASRQAVRELSMTGAMDFLAAGGTEPPVFYAERWAYVPIGVQGDPELYDLENDSGALDNVIERHTDVAHDLRGKIRDELEGLGVPAAVIDRLRPGA